LINDRLGVALIHLGSNRAY